MRIVAALVNPEGSDPGNETVTLINKGVREETLEGWRLEGPNGNSQTLTGKTIRAGDAFRLELDNSQVQLSNKGGRIRLIDRNGKVVHTVAYSKGQARTDGETILF